MRQSKLKAKELEEDEFRHSQNRKHGYSMAQIRDRGWVRFSNGSVMEWHVNRPLEEYEARKVVPEGHFFLDGKLYDSDEFRKWERWV